MKLVSRRLLSLLLSAVFTAVCLAPQILAVSDVVPGTYSFVQQASSDDSSVSLAERWDAPSYIAKTRSQGMDSLSWGFSAIAVLEANNGNTNRVTFSENHMRYALSTDSGNIYGFPRSYTDGGNRNMVTAYFMRDTLGGPVYSVLDPYSSGGVNPPRALSETTGRSPSMRVSGVIYIPDAPDSSSKAVFLDRVKRYVWQNGAVSVSVAYMPSLFDGDTYRQTDSSAAPDHSVTIIGWDNHEMGSGAFYVKDSLAGRCYWMSFDTVMKDAYTFAGIGTKDFDSTYEYDFWGQTGTMGFDSHSAYFANVFTVGSEAEALTAVSYFVTGENTGIEIFVSPVISGDVTTALHKAVMQPPAATELAALPGYYTTKLPELAYLNVMGGKFAVIIKASTPYGTSPIPLQDYSVSPGAAEISAEGQSYISSEGENWVDSYSNHRANVCVKAHVRTGLDIPLRKVTLESTSGAEPVNSMKVLYTNPQAKIDLGPTLTPANANNIESVSWLVGNGNGENFAPLSALNVGLFTLDEKTGSLTSLQTGTVSVRADVKTTDGKIFSDTVLLDISDIDVMSLSLDQYQAEIASDQTLQLTAQITPDNATARELIWSVVSDPFGTPFDEAYDITYPGQPGGPVATISKDGLLTPVQAGVCYAMVQTPDGSAKALCKVTINEIGLTGFALNKNKLTLSTSTQYTLVPDYKPKNATYREAQWESDAPQIARVDPRFGVITAVSPGTAIITATTRSGNTSSCAVTVTARPSKVLNLSKSASFSMDGVPLRSNIVEFDLLDSVPGQSVAVFSHSTEATRAFSGTQKNNRFTVAADNVGGALLKATIRVNRGTDDDPDMVMVAEQSWRIEGVNPIKKIKITDDNGQYPKGLSLCVGETDPRKNQRAILSAVLIAPGNGTLLPFEWTSKNPDIASVRVLGDPYDNKNTRVVVTAHALGSTQISAVNQNGNKKATLTVKVFNAPESVSMSKGSQLSVVVGKSGVISARAAGGKNLRRELSYHVSNVDTNPVPHTADNPIVTVNSKGKVTALREGTVLVSIYAAPYNTYAARATAVVSCYVPLKKITVSTLEKKLAIGGRTPLNISYTPENATAVEVEVLSSNDRVVSVSKVGKRYYVTGESPGKARITVQTADGKKRGSCIVTVAG